MSAINYLTLRSTLFYSAGSAGTLPPGSSIITTDPNGLQVATNNIKINTATYSTLSGGSVTVSSITAPVILGTTTLGQNVSYPNRFVEMGTDTTNSMYLDFHSNDASLPDYSTRIQSLGGGTTGTGVMNLYASTIGIMAPAGVGIGKTNPAYALDVAGTVNITGSYYVNGAQMSSSQWTTNSSIIYYNGGNVGIGTASPAQILDLTSSSTTPSIRIQSQYSACYVSVGAVLGINSYIGLQSGVATSSALGTPPFVVTNANTVGVNTTNPAYALDVTGYARATSGLLAGNGTSAVSLQLFDLPAASWQITTGGYNLSINNNSASWTNRVTILQNGYVGIGMTNPSYTLDINGGSYIYNLAVRSSGSDSIIDLVNTSAAGYVWRLGSSGTGSGGGTGCFYIYGASPGNTGTKMVVNASGYVGIGTVTPAATLDVNGTIVAGNNTGGLSIKNASGTIKNLMTLDTSNVLRIQGGGGAIYLNNDNTGTSVGVNYASAAAFNVYNGTNLTMTCSASGTNVGIGTGSLTSSALTVYPSITVTGQTFVVGGSVGTFYPVLIDTSPSWDTTNTYKISLSRSNVHADSTWKGSMTFILEGHITAWGNGADYSRYKFVGSNTGTPTWTNFIANYIEDPTSRFIVLMLRGLTTYNFSGEGCVLYNGNGSGTSLTIPGGNNSVYASTTTISPPFDGTYAFGDNRDNLFGRNGYVGIGTNNPNTLLHVNGSINCTGLVVNGTSVATGTGSVWSVSGSTIMYTSGNVGIGTGTPNNLLHLHSGFANSGMYLSGGLLFTASNGSNTWQTGSIIPYIAANATGTYTTDGYPGGLAFSTKTPDNLYTTAASVKMVLNANGYLGVGVTNPSSLCSVVGGTTMLNSSTYGASTVGYVSPAPALHLRGGNSATTQLIWECQNINTCGISCGSAAGLSYGAQVGGHIFRVGSAGNGDFSSSGSVAMIINGSSQVGIGTASPTNLLTVSQLGSNYTKPVLVLDAGISANATAGAPRGIGSPLLGIGALSFTSGSVAGDYYGIGFGYGGHIAGNYYPAEIGLYVQNTGGAEWGDIVFSTRNVTSNTVASERMRVTGGGFVGIGTSSPAWKCHIYGTGSTEAGLLIRSTSTGDTYSMIGMGNDTYPAAVYMFLNSSTRTADGGANCFTVRNDQGDLRLHAKGALGIQVVSTTGFVGIGVTNPQAPLHVGTLASNGASGSAAINYGGIGPGYITSWNGTAGVLNGGAAGSRAAGATGIFSMNDVVSGNNLIAMDFVSFSDVRIKKNIETFGRSALELIHKVRIVSYDHIDFQKPSCAAGIIAQEIEEVFPECIKHRKDIVPNIYRPATHSKVEDHVRLQLVDENGKAISRANEDVLNAKRVSLRIYRDNREHHVDMDVIKTDGSLFHVSSWPNYTDADEVFVFGTEVEDFRVIDKEMVAMVGIKAIQDVDDKVTMLEQENATLKSQLASLLQWAQQQGYKA